jgi:hypothetical protein
MKTFIYALIDPKKQQEFHIYIGKSNNPYLRYYQHLKDKNHTYKTCWIKSLLINKLVPDIQILEQCNVKDWENKEKSWITFYKNCGYIVVNSTDGGESGPFTEEHRKKISDSKKGQLPWISGKHHSKKSKIKMSLSHKNQTPYWRGKHLSEVTKKKLRDFNNGKHLSKKTKNKIRKARLGKHHNIKSIQKMKKIKLQYWKNRKSN